MREAARKGSQDKEALLSSMNHLNKKKRLRDALK